MGLLVKILFHLLNKDIKYVEEVIGSPVACFSRMLAKDELMGILEQCVKVLNSSTEKQLSNTAQKIKGFLTQFQNLDGKCNILPIDSPLTRMS